MSAHRRFGTAWLLFAIALALHVMDEATHDFLSVYNPNARMIRERFHIPIPVLTFEEFVVGLGAAIIILMLLSPFAYGGQLWLRRLAKPLAIVAGLFNAVLHFAGSLYYHRPMPGVYSSPILLAAGMFLLHAASCPRGR
jgi:hypothetical protein